MCGSSDEHATNAFPVTATNAPAEHRLAGPDRENESEPRNERELSAAERAGCGVLDRVASQLAGFQSEIGKIVSRKEEAFRIGRVDVTLSVDLLNKLERESKQIGEDMERAIITLDAIAEQSLRDRRKELIRRIQGATEENDHEQECIRRKRDAQADVAQRMHANPSGRR